MNLLCVAGSPAPDWRAPCRAQRLSWESDVGDGARKLGAALEDGSCPLGGPCGLRAKEKTDLERMEVATMGSQRLIPFRTAGPRKQQVQVALDWQGRSVYNGDLEKSPGRGHGCCRTLGWVTQKGVSVLAVTTAALTKVLVCLIMAGRLQFGVERDRIL